jgi:hypothetical protein
MEISGRNGPERCDRFARTRSVPHRNAFSVLSRSVVHRTERIAPGRLHPRFSLQRKRTPLDFQGRHRRVLQHYSLGYYVVIRHDVLLVHWRMRAIVMALCDNSQ